MDGSTWLYFLLGGVVAVVILGVVVADLIRKKDFTGIAPESPYRACPASAVG